MPKTPIFVLIAAIFATIFGVGLLVMSRKEEDLAWYGVPVLILGLLMSAIWVRSYRRPPEPQNQVPSPPGPWYPFAIMLILVLLAGWWIYWSKLNKPRRQADLHRPSALAFSSAELPRR
jgi:drug/metabolite transporter (DMT)-like permease